MYCLVIVLAVVVNFNGVAQQKSEGQHAIETKGVFISQAPNDIVRTITQDKKGIIWIASWEGIFKFDGKSFTNVTAKVSSARFFSVLEDRKGKFWFGSIGSGVYYYDGKSFQNFTVKDGLAGNDVASIYEDTSGNIWFGTKNGVSIYDGNSFQKLKMNEAPPVNETDSVHISAYQKPLPDVHWIHNDVNAVIQDKTGKFWFGTRGNATVQDAPLNNKVGQGKTFSTVTRKDGKPFTNVRSIIKDKKGNIWLGGADGLWRYDGSTFTNLTQKFVGYIMEDKKGNIWTSSESAANKDWAISRYDVKTLYDKNPAVTEIKSGGNGFFGILEANDGSIWFGSMDGVYRYDGKSITHFKSKEDN